MWIILISKYIIPIPGSIRVPRGALPRSPGHRVCLCGRSRTPRARASRSQAQRSRVRDLSGLIGVVRAIEWALCTLHPKQPDSPTPAPAPHHSDTLTYTHISLLVLRTMTLTHTHTRHTTHGPSYAKPVREHGSLKRVLPLRSTLTRQHTLSRPTRVCEQQRSPASAGTREATLGDNGVRIRILDDDQQKVRVWRHHDLVLLRPDPEEGQIVLRVEVPHD